MSSRSLGCHSYVCANMLSCKMSGTLHLLVFFYCEGLVLGIMQRGGERAQSCKARLVLVQVFLQERSQMRSFQGGHALGSLVSSAESSDVSGLPVGLSDGINCAVKDTVDIGQ